MSMTVGSVNNTYAPYPTQNTRKNTQISEKEANQGDYLKELQEKNPQIDIVAGNPDRNAKAVNHTGRTEVRISPKFLDKMMGDPQIAAKYEDMLSTIPALDRWADSMIKTMTGSEVKYRQVWIDDEGNMGSMCITGSGEKQKKMDAERKENEQKTFEERIEKRREQVKEKSEQLAKKLLEKKVKNSKNGEITFDHDDMQLLIQTAGNRNAMENKAATDIFFDMKI